MKLPTTSAALAAIAFVACAAGCASVAVSDDAIATHTAAALGLQQGTFTIANLVNDGVTSRYTVTTAAGKQYSCYVTGSVSVVGRVVSDAVCSANGNANASGKAIKQAGANAPSCNALLQAAGKC